MYIKDTILLRVLMLQDVDQGRYERDVGDLEERLYKPKKTYNERQLLLKSLQEYEDK